MDSHLGEDLSCPPSHHYDGRHQNAPDQSLESESEFPEINKSRLQAASNPMHLLSLPPELLLMILSECTPSSFSLALLTCRTIRSLVLNSKDTIRRQLKRLPGFNEDLTNPTLSMILQDQSGPENQTEEPTAEQLLVLFNRRAARHLGNGVIEQMDVHCFQPSHKAHPNESLLSRCHSVGHKECKKCFIADLDREENTIRVFKIDEAGVHGEAVIYPEALAAVAEVPNAEIHIIRMAFQQPSGPRECIRKIAVLFRYRLPPEDRFKGYSANKDGSSSVLKLACLTIRHDVHRPWKPKNVRDVHYEWDFAKPTAVAVSSNGDAAIAFDSNRLPMYEIVSRHGRSLTSPSRYGRSSHNPPPPPPPPPPPFPINPPPPLPPGLPFPPPPPPTPPPRGLWSLTPGQLTNSIKPIGSRFLFSCKGWPVPLRWWENGIHRDIRELPAYNHVFFDVPRAIPFAADHECRLTREGDGNVEVFCVDTVLQLGIRYLPINLGDKYPNIPRVYDSFRNVEGIYLIKGSAEQSEDEGNCRPIDLHGDYPVLEHKFVARLAGLDHRNLQPSSLGLRTSISACGRRVAIANWDQVYVWAVEPAAFFSSHGAVDIYKSSNDPAYTRRCGHRFYRRIDSSGLVTLYPIALPTRGVIHSLVFRTPDELLAWTGHSLVRWYWGPGRTACRDTIPLMPTPTPVPGCEWDWDSDSDMVPFNSTLRNSPWKRPGDRSNLTSLLKRMRTQSEDPELERPSMKHSRLAREDGEVILHPPPQPMGYDPIQIMEEVWRG